MALIVVPVALVHAVGQNKVLASRSITKPFVLNPLVYGVALVVHVTMSVANL
jgi:ABC-type molybdate transport system permease subunit